MGGGVGGLRETFIELSMVSSDGEEMGISGCRLLSHFVKAGNLRGDEVGVKEEEEEVRRRKRGRIFWVATW